MKGKIKYLILLVTAFFVVACSSYEDTEALPSGSENEIYGVWIDTVTAQPQGYYIHELVIQPNGSFLSGARMFGIYSGQGDNELSGYFEQYGNYVLSKQNIYFVAKQTVSWDSFTSQPPLTSVKDVVIFESCTYKVNGKTLELTYITYPADAPVITKRIYTKTRSDL